MKEIKLHPESIEYLNAVFDIYTTEKKLTWDSIVTNPIIHLYANSDTRNEDGELDGYVDSLFFTVDIYDPVNRIKYTTKSKHDSLDLFNTGVRYVRIFKDGSTLVKFIGDYKIQIGTAIHLWKVDKD